MSRLHDESGYIRQRTTYRIVQVHQWSRVLELAVLWRGSTCLVSSIRFYASCTILGLCEEDPRRFIQEYHSAATWPKEGSRAELPVSQP